jgi:hypothetical protein
LKNIVKHINIFIVLFLLFSFSSEAQRWKRTRYELIYGIGYSSVFGDIGGGASKGGNIATSIKDFDIQAVRPSFAVGARFRVTEAFALKANLIYGYMAGADKYSSYTARQRGVSFSSPIFEQSLQAEYSVVKERLGRRYTLSNIKGFKNLHINTYFIVGFGGVSFNPTTKAPDSTGVIREIPKDENNGQSAFSDGGTFPHYTMIIPVGIGFKYGINRKLSLAIEYANRFTFTDYLDNHHDTFSKGNDSYMFMTFTISYKLRTTRNGWPKF